MRRESKQTTERVLWGLVTEEPWAWRTWLQTLPAQQTEQVPKSLHLEGRHRSWESDELICVGFALFYFA